jgi:hypothetical protein
VSDITPRRDEPFVTITTKDGTAIRCQLLTFPLSPGRGAMAEQRWVFSTVDGRQHIGPPSSTVGTRIELELLVDEWWTARRASWQTPRQSD